MQLELWKAAEGSPCRRDRVVDAIVRQHEDFVTVGVHWATIKVILLRQCQHRPLNRVLLISGRYDDA